jgi:hypothetical protein
MTRDPGRQPERTILAWRRTALTASVVTALVGRQALMSGAVGGVLTVLALAGWFAVVAITEHRAATIAPAPPEPSRALPLLALVTVGFAVLGLILVFAPVA